MKKKKNSKIGIPDTPAESTPPEPQHRRSLSESSKADRNVPETEDFTSPVIRTKFIRKRTEVLVFNPKTAPAAEPSPTPTPTTAADLKVKPTIPVVVLHHTTNPNNPLFLKRVLGSVGIDTFVMPSNSYRGFRKSTTLVFACEADKKMFLGRADPKLFGPKAVFSAPKVCDQRRPPKALTECCHQYGHTHTDYRASATCFHCGKPHRSFLCPTRSATSPHCATCHGDGHFTGQVKCPKYPKKEPVQAKLAPVIPPAPQKPQLFNPWFPDVAVVRKPDEPTPLRREMRELLSEATQQLFQSFLTILYNVVEPSLHGKLLEAANLTTKQMFGHGTVIHKVGGGIGVVHRPTRRQK